MREDLPLFIDHLDTPIGRLAIVADDQGCLHDVGWLDTHDRMETQLARYAKRGLPLTPVKNPSGLTDALRAYFAGELTVIDDLRVATCGTAFQESVWRALREIPCGETWSYGQLARHIGNPTAVRAVGAANGANPVGIVVPCHRVIGKDGTLTGYGGSLPRKRWLLTHERSRGAALEPPLEAPRART